MKNTISLFLILITICVSSCQSNTATGVLVGGVVGAGVGGAIGGGQGALIGGAAGVIGGGLIGASLDEQDRRSMEQSSPRTVDRMDRGEPLTINDVIRLSQGGVSDKTIIQYMQKTNSTYSLSQAQIRRLQDGGVSQKVIDYMINNR